MARISGRENFLATPITFGTQDFAALAEVSARKKIYHHIVPKNVLFIELLQAYTTHIIFVLTVIPETFLLAPPFLS